jgi:hypothetical protein
VTCEDLKTSEKMRGSVGADVSVSVFFIQI